MKEQSRTKMLAHDIPLRFVKLLNVILMTIPFAWCWYGYYVGQMENSFYKKGNLLMLVLFMLVYFMFARVYSAFLVSVNRISEMVYSQVLAVLITDGITYLVIVLLVKGFPSVIPGLLAIAGQTVISFVWCTLAHLWYFHTFPPQKTMIVYDVREGMEKLISQYDMQKKFKVQEVLQVEECLNDMKKLDEMETVFLSGIHSRERNIILKYCIDKHVRVYVIPRVGDVLMSGAKQIHMFHLPMLRIGRYDPQPEYLFLKRLADIVFAGAATIILSPVMLITAIAIKAYDGGPVFYSQTRLTKNGREFGVLKFRSMKVNAEKDGVARLSSGENDPRITPVGRLIRKIHFDEIPQLFNILKGDMSIVGPRPERQEIASQYEEIIPEFRYRLKVKAGLTGYAQVYGKYNTTPYDKLKLDMLYIENYSFWLDIKILLMTFKVILQKENSEGIDENQITALKREIESKTTTKY